LNTDQLPVIDLKGSPRDRGRIHGEELRHDIEMILEKKEAVRRATWGERAGAHWEAFKKYQNFTAAVECWTPDLMQEIRGIAEGAAISFETAFLLQLMDEEWVFGAYHGQKPQNLEKCTSFAAMGEYGQPTWCGQNMDITGYAEGHQVLFRISYDDSDIQSYVYTHAGLIGLNGMNSSPLGLCCNTLIRLAPSNDGLPVAFVLRSILTKTCMADAVAFIKKIQHASGQNYIISTTDRIGCFECSANEVVDFKGRQDGLRVCHTNHALANKDKTPFEDLIKTDNISSWARHSANSHSRYSSIAGRLVHNSATISLDKIKSALCAKDDPVYPVSLEFKPSAENNVIGFTAGSMIYELSSSPKLHLASGPPSITEFKTFVLSNCGRVHSKERRSHLVASK
jgi:isopenicillin-N N-acyltransferase-like protein